MLASLFTVLGIKQFNQRLKYIIWFDIFVLWYIKFPGWFNSIVFRVEKNTVVLFDLQLGAVNELFYPLQWNLYESELANYNFTVQ